MSRRPSHSPRSGRDPFDSILPLDEALSEKTTPDGSYLRVDEGPDERQDMAWRSSGPGGLNLGT
jgi:hypothetical protein